jgi:hypothetical protein
MEEGNWKLKIRNRGEGQNAETPWEATASVVPHIARHRPTRRPERTYETRCFLGPPQPLDAAPYRRS